METQSNPNPRLGFAASLIVFLAAGWYFSQSGGGLAAEPPFADEAAVLAQTRYYRLVAEGRFDDPDWIDHAAFDHQPLYKYATGFALHVTGQYESVPSSLDEFKRWMNRGVRPPPMEKRLLTARWAMVVGASLAVAFAFAFTRRLAGLPIALAAAVVFASSPLVYTHARRAMIDLTAVGLCVVVLWAACRLAAGSDARKTVLANFLIAALLAALAPLAKWNAASGIIAALSIAFLLLLVGPNRLRLSGLLALAAMLLGGALFVGLDPFYWSTPNQAALAERLKSVEPFSAVEYRKLANASPLERGRHALDYRRQTLASARTAFPNDYLSPAERPGAVVLQGMGRWSLGNRLYSIPEAELPRAQRRQWRDYVIAGIIGSLSLIGFVSAIRRGWRERSRSTFPIHWLLVAWIAVDVALLLGNLTLDWDRYYLSVVAWSSIAAALGLRAIVAAVVGQLRLSPKELTRL